MPKGELGIHSWPKFVFALVLLITIILGLPVLYLDGETSLLHDENCDQQVMHHLQEKQYADKGRPWVALVKHQCTRVWALQYPPFLLSGLM
jgi:hypothetical protein